MDFKKLKTDELAFIANLISREAGARSPELAAALRRIEIEADGRHGSERPNLRLTIALAPGVKAAIVGPRINQNASLAMLLDGVRSFVAVAERILDDRRGTIAMIGEVRATLSREIAKARRRGLPYRTLEVSLTPSQTRSHDLPATSIEVEVLGPLLDPERFAFNAENAEDVKGAFAGMREKQERRLVMRDHLKRVGADVMIDAVTLAALRDADVCPTAAVADLHASDIGIIDVDTRYGRMPLYVRDSVVTGNVPLGGGMRWKDGRLIVPKEERISITGVKGRPVKDVIAHDFFDDALKVDSASEFNDNIWLYVHPKPIPVSLAPVRAAA